MRDPTAFDGREERTDTHPAAGWMIPIAFFIATAGSLAVGLAAPGILGPANPWADRAALNAPSETAQTGEDDYLQGLARARHDMHAPNATDKPASSVNHEVIFCGLVGKAHPI
jgi:hypothetical protein